MSGDETNTKSSEYKQSDHQDPDEKKRDEILKRMLETPPKPRGQQNRTTTRNKSPK